MKRALFTTTFLTVAFASGLAAAQQAASGGLEEIVVTAQRREEPLQKVPIAVTAISPEALQNRQITQSQDLQRIVPSLKMTNNVTTPTNLSPSLRGSTQQDASLVVAESPFGIYVDDVYIPRLNGNNAELADIERVEVLRGPQGTLYGRNTLAGAIKFVSRTPGNTTWLNLLGGYGNWNQYRASFSVGGPLNDSWAASLAAQANGKGGEFTNLATKKDVGKERNWAARGKLHYMGGEAFDAVASFSYAKSNNDALQQTPALPSKKTPAGQFYSGDLVPVFGFYTINRPNLPRSPFPIESEPRGETKQLIGSLNMSYDFGAATLRSITGFTQLRDFFNTDFSGLGLIMAASNVKSDEFTEELQLQGKLFEDRLNYTTGAYYLKERASQTFGWQFFTPTSTSLERSRIESVALFGQADLKITDELKATAGVRWSHDKKNFFLDFRPLPTSVVPGRRGTQSLENSYSQVTPRFVLDYAVPTSGAIDSMLLYVSAARGFKSGGYNGIVIFDVSEGGAPYNPEKNWTYEAGIKTDLLDKHLRVNAAYFINNVTDLTLNATVNLPGGVSIFPVQNAGSTQIKGLEMEVTAIPFQGLNVFFNAAFDTGRYRSFRTGSAAANAAAAYGVAVPPQVPKYTFTTGFDYGFDVPLGGNDGRLSFGVDWFRTGKYFIAADNQHIISPYSRVNGFVALEINKRWEARLSVKNLENNFTYNSGALSLGGFIIQPPREVMGTISYKM
jgi:iron complex outermembrane receptor protein